MSDRPENPIVSTLRRQAYDLRRKELEAQNGAEVNERIAREYRAKEKIASVAASAAEQAIRDIEAADRRRALYGREVLQ